MSEVTNNPSRKRGGISAETTGIQTAKFKVSNENWLNRAVITEVKYEELESKKEGDDTKFNTLVFVFRGAGFIKNPEDQAVPLFVHREFEVLAPTTTGKTIEDQEGWQDARIAQIYNTFMGIKAHVKAKDGKSLGASKEGTTVGFFKSVADSFNTMRDGKPVFRDSNGIPIDFALSLVYDKNNNLQLPFGNFMDARSMERTLLTKNPRNKYEMTTASTRKDRNMGGNGGSDTKKEDLPQGW